jgi:hypothetical protein
VSRSSLAFAERQAGGLYPGTEVTAQLRPGRLRFFRTVAESVGVQGPTGGVVIGAALLAGISGGGTALVEVVAAVAMGFVAYAFVLFTRSFNSAGSVYGFTGAAVAPWPGFLSALALLFVYINFAGRVVPLSVRCRSRSWPSTRWASRSS